MADPRSRKAFVDSRVSDEEQPVLPSVPNNSNEGLFDWALIMLDTCSSWFTSLVARVSFLEDAGLISEAPIDGTQYAREDGTWTAVSGGQWDDVAGGIAYTDGKVGIGTTTPDSIYGGRELAVMGGIAVQGNSRGWYMDAKIGADDLRIGNRISSDTADSDHVTIAADGNVGIGTTTPSSKLSILGEYSGVTLPLPADMDIGVTLASSDTGDIHGGIGWANAAFTQNRAAMHAFDAGTSAATGLLFATRDKSATYAERIRIDSAGRLGVGTIPSDWATASISFSVIDIGDYASVFGMNLDANRQTGFYNNGYYSDAGTPAWHYKADGAMLGYQQVVLGSSYYHTFSSAPVGVAGETVSPDHLMVIRGDSGNVGIGTTPTRRLQVDSGGFGIVAHFSGGALSNNAGISIGDATTTSDTAVAFRAAGDNALFFAGSSERMRITSAGNVGIGTSSPSAALHVRDTDTSVAAGEMMRLQTSSGGNLRFYVSDLSVSNPEWVIQTNSSESLVFNIGGNYPGAERMRITSAGNVLVGTTTDRGGSRKMQVWGNTNGNGPVTVVKNSATTGAGQHFLNFYTSNGSVGNGGIAGNGASSAAFISFSDRTLKENITPLEGELANILALQPCEFDFKGGEHQIGFVAQEMEEVYPDAVGEVDGYKTIVGWGKTESRLVKAIQELSSKNDVLESQNAALAARQDALEARLARVEDNSTGE